MLLVVISKTADNVSKQVDLLDINSNKIWNNTDSFSNFLPEMIPLLKIHNKLTHFACIINPRICAK